MGIDFGTDSVRSIVADATTGRALGTSVKYYPRWAKGLYCDPVENRFRQHPLDYLESMESSLLEALGEAGSTVAGRVRGIAVDTTGSTPVLADRGGKPLALSAPFAENPNAMFVLWKDHTAVAEAERLNHLARTWGEWTTRNSSAGSIRRSGSGPRPFTSSRRDSRRRAKAAVTIVEHCDWIPAGAHRHRRCHTVQAESLRCRTQGPVARRVRWLSVQRLPCKAEPPAARH